MESERSETQTKRDKNRPKHWFSGASVAELHRRIGVVGFDRARLEVYQDGDTMTFEVVDPDVDDDEETWPPINDSHRCPPDCP